MGKLILVGDLEAGRVSSRLTAVYARVPSADQRDDLDRQVARVCSCAVANGFSIDPRGHRGRFRAERQGSKVSWASSDPKVTTIPVENRDRLAGFGSEHLAASFEASGRRLVVIDDGALDDDLVWDDDAA
jgi:predicted site-specific integrase-resolvase